MGRKTCTKCNLGKPLSSFYSDIGKKDGNMGCCKKCFIIISKKYTKTRRGRFTTYKRHSKQRGYEFKLTFREFKSLWKKPCTYCGHKIKGIRLDRMNNDIGYLFKNVTPCCKNCNYAKRQMTVKEFISHCQKVAKKAKKDKTA